MRLLVLAVALVLSAGCIPEPSDPVALGDLCVPEVDGCPQASVLARDAVGRNQFDYSISNQGSREATVRIAARVPNSDVDAGDAEDLTIVERAHVIQPGESVGSRWTPQDLGTRESFEIALLCVGCDVRASYVLTSVPLECVEDDDCSGGWFCDTNIPGRCVECISDGDCSVDQRCDTQRGRCNPPETSSCATAAGSGGGLLLLLLCFFAFRRRGVFVAALIATTLVFSEARAAAPAASISVGANTHSLLGEIGENADIGVGITIGQELRWTYFGASVRLGTTFFLTDQPAPPFSKGLRTYMVAIGPRGYIPFGNFELVYGIDYARLGFSSNSLVRSTGTDIQFNSALAVLGARYRASGLEVRLEGGWQPIFGVEGSVITLDLAFALATGL